MRLINADKITITRQDYVGALTLKERLQRLLNLQPTVEAIPTEWIEKWFSQFYGEQGLEWNRCKRFMLEDWEKENGLS